MSVEKEHIFTLKQIPQWSDEIFELLAKGKNLKIERIISNGQTTPPGQWFDSPQTEWVILLQGKAKLAFDNNQQMEMQAGDHITIPPHIRHRIIFTSQQPPCVWVAVHYNE